MTIKLTEKHINTLKEIVLDHLQGTEPNAIQFRLQMACGKFKTGCRALYESIPLNTPIDLEDINKINPLIPAILESLNIKPPHDAPRSVDASSPPRGQSLESRHWEEADDDQKMDYQQALLSKHKNLYELLRNLSSEGHEHLKDLLEMIERTKPKSNWTLIFMIGALLSAGIGGLAYHKKEAIEAISAWFAKTFPLMIKWLSKSFSFIRNFHLLASVVNALMLMWTWYKTLTSYTTTSNEKFHLFLFNTLSAGLTITAYILCFFAGGTATLPAILLFVGSTATNFFQGAFNWWKSHSALNKRLPEFDALLKSNPDIPWEVHAEHVRAMNFQMRARNSAWVKIVSSLLTTISVSIWFSFPLNFVVSACFMSFNFLIALTEQSIITSINEHAKINLQAAVEGIPQMRGARLRPANQDDRAKLHLQQEFFKKEQATLHVALQNEKAAFKRETEQTKEQLATNARAIKSTRDSLLQEQSQLQEREALRARKEAEFSDRANALGACEQLLLSLSENLSSAAKVFQKLQRPEDHALRTPSTDGVALSPAHSASASFFAPPLLPRAQEQAQNDRPLKMPNINSSADISPSEAANEDTALPADAANASNLDQVPPDLEPLTLENGFSNQLNS